MDRVVRPAGLLMMGVSGTLAAVTVVRDQSLGMMALALAGCGLLAYAATVVLDVHSRGGTAAALTDLRDGGLARVSGTEAELGPQGSQLIEEALRNLNEPASLARSGLIASIPYTVAAALSKQ